MYEVEDLEHREAVRSPITIELIDNLMQDVVHAVLYTAASDVHVMPEPSQLPLPDRTHHWNVQDKLRDAMNDLQHLPEGRQRLLEIMDLLSDKDEL